MSHDFARLPTALLPLFRLMQQVCENGQMLDSQPPTPVFIISFNRGEMVRKCIRGMNHLNRSLRFIIHDNGSDDKDTLNILDELSKEGVIIYRSSPINKADDLNQVNDSIVRFFSDHRTKSTNYIVTDCDIDMSIARPDAIDIYERLLALHEEIQCVGPMLRIHDIPKSYPLYNRLMNRHIEQFWQFPPTWIETDRLKVAVQKCLIDTTFALHRKGDAFRRLKNAMRVYEPFEALHLDWYRQFISPDTTYSASSSNKISHWDNYQQLLKHQDARLQYVTYIRVVSESGELVEVHEKI